jgi:hypothetical protein
MTVYVDNMRAKFGRMIMCHMIAETDSELHEMADRIGIARRWHQGDHYDISLNKRALAIEHGAVAITLKQCGCMTIRRRATGVLGLPADAEEWARRHIRDRRQEENDHDCVG